MTREALCPVQRCDPKRAVALSVLLVIPVCQERIVEKTEDALVHHCIEKRAIALCSVVT